MGGVYALTMQPTAAIATVSDATLKSLALACAAINAKGVPILLRYGHEMNGDWTSYGVHPVNYVKGFQRMSLVIKQYTNLTAMVWSPNVGINYPFSTAPPSFYPTNKTDPANFQALDTNSDGVIDWKDDPYGPYYPGDDYVDWIGLSLYWYPDEELGYNGQVIPTYFADELTGSGPAIERVAVEVLNDGGLRNFYGRFVATSGKPFIIAETAAPWIIGKPATQTELQVKQQWWQQIYNSTTFKQFPRLKGVLQFEEIKTDGLGVTRDFRVLANSDVAAGFRADLNNLKSTMLYAQQLNFACGGQVQIVA
ncbi:hypothetical protein HDU91_004171 [Kappamyces sp. JEL0680]|nr:hypothetical protein HDU91_004171 [Kappamyces sp. JEL0680]